MKKEDIAIGSKYVFTKSGSIVNVIGKSSTGPNHFVVARVDTGKQMIATSDGLEKEIE